MTPLIKKISRIVNLSCEVVWFDVGIEKWEDKKWDLEVLSRLPFDSISLVCRSESDSCDVVVIATQKNDFVCVMGYGLGEQKHTKAPIITYRVSNGKISFLNEKKQPIYNLSEIEDSRRGIELLLKLLLSLRDGGHGYKMKSRKSPTNARRAAKGKPPLSVDWHTVTIEPMRASEASPHAGTHASPRKHQRRGHWRNHQNGKRVWVRDCWVGDASIGMVFKDYEVKTC